MPSFVGVTKCPVGIAHTYMAAEKLQKTGQSDGYKVKVETQGASGTEDTLTADDIKTADFVVLAIDVAIDGMERFVGKRVVFSTTAEAIKDPQKLIDAQGNMLKFIPVKSSMVTSKKQVTLMIQDMNKVRLSNSC